MDQTARSSPIIYDETELETVPGRKDFFPLRLRQMRNIGALEVEQFAESLRLFCATIGQAFQGTTTAIKEFELRTFELNVDVTAKDEIRLIGSASTELKS